MVFIIYIGRVSRYVRKKCYKGLRGQNFELYNSREIFVRLKKEFGKGNDKTMKIVRLKKVKQGSKMV